LNCWSIFWKKKKRGKKKEGKKKKGEKDFVNIQQGEPL
jgi:hypothetical protein